MTGVAEAGEIELPHSDPDQWAGTRCGSDRRGRAGGVWFSLRSSNTVESTMPGWPAYSAAASPATTGAILAHGGSLIFHSECQMRYITQVLELLIAGDHRPVEPRAQPLHARAGAVAAADLAAGALDPGA